MKVVGERAGGGGEGEGDQRSSSSSSTLTRTQPQPSPQKGLHFVDLSDNRTDAAYHDTLLAYASSTASLDTYPSSHTLTSTLALTLLPYLSSPLRLRLANTQLPASVYVKLLNALAANPKVIHTPPLALPFFLTLSLTPHLYHSLTPSSSTLTSLPSLQASPSLLTHILSFLSTHHRDDSAM